MQRSIDRPLWALFVGPYGVYLVILLVVPLVNIAVYSVYTYSPTKIAVPDLTAANYARLWDAYYIQLFLRTTKLALVTTVICAVLGYPVAYTLARARPALMSLGLFLLVVPLMVSTVIRVFGWVVILGRNGLVNEVLDLLGLEPFRVMYTETAVVIGLVNIFMPFMVLPMMSAIERIPPSFEEAATNLGANWFQMFARVILPLSYPGLVSGSLLVYSVSLSAFVTPVLMGGARIRVIGSQIFDEVLVSFNWPGASSLALVVIAATTMLVLVALRATRAAARLESRQ
ncbi:MAG: ABC transporter permease [Proteobacteria bacterium]|nr:ABC transporter permease [Pseudomonadota bacterium]